MKVQIKRAKLKNFIFVCGLLTVICGLLGCDAFVRKFTRKHKKENLPQEEMVLAPEEYKTPQMTKEELYRQYFLFWKSWHDELIESLLQQRSQKKQIDCVGEAIGNLNELRRLLNAEKQKQLDTYILQLKELQGQISKDIYGNSIMPNTQRAESIKRNILRDFSYNKIKNYLI